MNAVSLAAVSATPAQALATKPDAPSKPGFAQCLKQAVASERPGPPAVAAADREEVAPAEGSDGHRDLADVASSSENSTEHEDEAAGTPADATDASLAAASVPPAIVPPPSSVAVDPAAAADPSSPQAPDAVAGLSARRADRTADASVASTTATTARASATTGGDKPVADTDLPQASAPVQPLPDARRQGAASAEGADPAVAPKGAMPKSEGRHVPSVTADGQSATDVGPGKVTPAETSPTATVQAPPANAAAALHAQGSALLPAGTSANAAPPGLAHLAPSVDSPAFGPALGAQVSLWVRDGVQEARLHLNPAEMGPVAVKIALDGAQARIDFSAERVATRQAIEAALPDLASSLNANGLTLAGGGVFDRPHRQDMPDRAPRRVAAARIGDAALNDLGDGVRGVTASTPRGLVDLVA
jgi:flagellar hook-length control protein FliK